MSHAGSVAELKLLKQIQFFPDFLNELRKVDPDVRVFIEKASTRPKQGIQQAFNYGAGWGELIGCVKSARMPLTLVPPAVWSRRMHAGTRLQDDTKARSFEACQLLFPGVSLIPPGGRVPHDGLAEALLIAEDGRRLLTGGLFMAKHSGTEISAMVQEELDRLY